MIELSFNGLFNFMRMLWMEQPRETSEGHKNYFKLEFSYLGLPVRLACRRKADAKKTKANG